MEYLLGSILTLVTMVILAKLIKKQDSQTKRISVVFSQTRQYELIKDFVPFQRKRPPKTQSRNHFNKRMVRILYINNSAYWIENNIFYTAIFDNGSILEDTKKAVDIMAMDSVELDKMIFIVDKLTEGLSDDSSNSGN